MLVSNSILSNLFERTETVLAQPLPPGAATRLPPAQAGGDEEPEVRAVVWPSA